MSLPCRQNAVVLADYPTDEAIDCQMMQQQLAAQYRGTISPACDFNARHDAEILRKATKGIGANEAVIANTMSQRSNAQRQVIVRTFKNLFGKDLIATLKSSLGGHLKTAILAMTRLPADFDARSIHKAISGSGTNDHLLMEIFCTRSNADIKVIAASYKSKYGKHLECSVRFDTGGNFKRFLISVLQGNRVELTPTQQEQVRLEGPACVVDRTLAAEEAAELYSAGELRFDAGVLTFLKLMVIRNVYQRRATFDEYQKVAGHHIMEAISKEMSGDIEKAFKTLVMTTMDTPAYFAYKLRDALGGIITKDTTLIRIVVSRSEVDMADIKLAFKKEYSKELADAIKSDISGDYKRLLVAIVRY